MALKNTKKYDKEKAKTWGSADYLLARFDDIQSVEELSRKCKDTKAVKAAVRSVSTPKDNLAACRVYRTSFQVPGEEAHTGVVARVNLGLNGKGVQEDYFLALARLTQLGFLVFDAFVDAVDDVASVLCTWRPRPSAAQGEARCGAGCKSGKAVKPPRPASGKGKADA